MTGDTPPLVGGHERAPVEHRFQPCGLHRLADRGNDLVDVEQGLRALEGDALEAAFGVGEFFHVHQLDRDDFLAAQDQALYAAMLVDDHALLEPLTDLAQNGGHTVFGGHIGPGNRLVGNDMNLGDTGELQHARQIDGRIAGTPNLSNSQTGLMSARRSAAGGLADSAEGCKLYRFTCRGNTTVEVVAGIVFAVLLVTVSYTVNRRILRDRLTLDAYRLALTAASVLLFAVIGESIVNPLYEMLVGSKLWEYRAYPLYDANVSALAVVVWTAYGVHLYFTRQALAQKLGPRWNSNFAKALIIGFEAPFVSEVSGNSLFLLLKHDYYAYYVPSDVFHLTSLRVVPVYVVCIYIGLTLLGSLERLPRSAVLPPALFAGGIAYLLAGSV